ncbi:MAG: hypothetical protein A4E51_01589 [Methanosaeta sp. PtaU1.Bin055]|nr:MAG: hypothetical protein A4E51_01589 [Methanosaeta sp. PtaU1.Bin055]
MISARSSKDPPTLFLESEVVSRRRVTSFSTEERALVIASAVRSNPTTFPESRWLPRWVTRYGIPRMAHLSSSAARASTDLAYTSSFGVARFGR